MAMNTIDGAPLWQIQATSMVAKKPTSTSAPISFNDLVSRSQGNIPAVQPSRRTAALQMESAWLQSHGMTTADLAAMAPAQQGATRQQMAQDVSNQMQQQLAAMGTK